jgi:hypothetical protein
MHVINTCLICLYIGPTPVPWFILVLHYLPHSLFTIAISTIFLRYSPVNYTHLPIYTSIHLVALCLFILLNLLLLHVSSLLFSLTLSSSLSYHSAASITSWFDFSIYISLLPIFNPLSLLFLSFSSMNFFFSHVNVAFFLFYTLFFIYFFLFSPTKFTPYSSQPILSFGYLII